MIKRIKDLINDVGICLKKEDGTVYYQNKRCQKLCGNQTNNICDQGCMKTYNSTVKQNVFNTGFHILKHINLNFENRENDHNDHIVDGIMINSGSNLTTVLFDKTNWIETHLRYLQNYSLTPSELLIMKKFFTGYKNSEIAKQLFISKSTLRTHLNNIYKKLPVNVKQELIKLHQGNEIS